MICSFQLIQRKAVKEKVNFDNDSEQADSMLTYLIPVSTLSARIIKSVFESMQIRKKREI